MLKWKREKRNLFYRSFIQRNLELSLSYFLWFTIATLVYVRVYVWKFQTFQYFNETSDYTINKNKLTHNFVSAILKMSNILSYPIEL